ALFAREVVEDLEMARAVADTAAAAELDRRIESIALAHQIASRLTSWVAATEIATVDPRAPVRRQRIPQELPLGMQAEDLGLARRSIPGGGAGMMPARRGGPTRQISRTRGVAQDRARGARKPPSPPVDKLGEAEAAVPEHLSLATGAAAARRRGRVLH